MKKTTMFKSLLVAAGLLVGGGKFVGTDCYMDS